MTKAHTCDGRLGLGIHALVFAVALALLLAIDLWTGPIVWIHWVLLGWAPGLVAHALARQANRG